MNRHQLPRHLAAYRLPEPPPAKVNPDAFMICPLVLVQGLPLECGLLYRMAFEQAQEALRPSLPERDLLAVWN